MQKQGKEFSIACEECCKKEKLIEKYLNLIDLLKKKSDKSLMSTTIRRSNDPIPENNSTYSQPLNRATLPFALLALAQNRKAEALLLFKQLDLEARCHKGYLFVQSIEKILNRRVIQTAKKLFGEGTGAKESVVLEQDRRGVDRSSSRNQSYYSVSAFLDGEKREKLKGLTRRVFELTQEVMLLRQQKRNSDELIEENLRRQEVESKKKKESLEMLAEEMAQKNEIITELQATLRFYEERQGRIDNNVLEEDGLALKRELEQMEKLNEKLGVELERKGEQLTRTQQELNKVRERAAKVQTEYAQLKERNFQLGIEVQDLAKRKQEYASLSLFLEKKMTSLKKYQRLITVNLRAIEQASISDRSSFNSTLKPKNSRLVLEDPPQSDINLQEKENKDFAPISKFQAQYKIEKILNYLYNIELDDVWINNEEKLFDNQELTVLNELKLKFINLQDQIKNKTPKVEPKVEVIANCPVRLSKQCGESDEVYFNEQHVSGSIFEVFASEKGNKDKEPQGKSVQEFDGRRGESRGEITTRRAEQGFTIKLLEMEIEKNKQVEKISQLKNKLFHIRSIVMNLIKSLQMKNLRPQSKDIIDVCFQFFEYSEQEKEIIFHTQPKKEKRFLGFF